MPILVILGLLMGGSASFAAETTVPGDVLYPVKVHVNESVRGAVAVSPAAKAEWELHLVERRLEEVEKLATRPNAAPQAQEQAQENLVKYTKHVEDRIAKFEEGEDSDHAIKTASDLSNVLAAYEQLLAALAAAQPASTGTATTTPATTATSTATSTPVVATTTPATTLTPANIAALREILSKLNEVQDDAEEKHKELKKKYHKEEKDSDEGEDNDEDGDEHAQWTPAPVVPPVATTTPGTATSTATTTPGTTSTSTATTTPSVVASSTARVRLEKHEEGDHREEIRGTVGTSTTATSTPRVSRERTESRDSHDDND